MVLRKITKSLWCWCFNDKNYLNIKIKMITIWYDMICGFLPFRLPRRCCFGILECTSIKV